jgi:hypothetical protein
MADITMLKLFLSYHHKDRKTAGCVKDHLTALGVEVFLAHEDLEPPTEWQKEILRRLRQCDVFIPLLTKSYHASLWTDQETGIALASKKFVLPLKFGTDPYGFIGKLQALKARKELSETCLKLVHLLASNSAFRQRFQDGAIDSFLKSSSFEESGRIAAGLPKLEPFSLAQLRRLVRGAATNSQICGGWAARYVVKKLIARDRARIGKKIVQSFEKQVEAWG